MAMQPSVERGLLSPLGETARTSWADDVDEPIRLARFPCCGRYVCRCGGDEEEEARVTR
jgi:hypothetical protein